MGLFSSVQFCLIIQLSSIQFNYSVQFSLIIQFSSVQFNYCRYLSHEVCVFARAPGTSRLSEWNGTELNWTIEKTVLNRFE